MEICVYCASGDRINPAYKQAGEILGEEIAKRGHTLVFGCGIYGVMGALARGVEKAKGKRIGVVPEFIEEMVTIDTNCTQLIRTKTMRQRKEIMEQKSDAFIMMPGGIGTFEEFFEILTLKQLKQHKKPIIIYNVNSYFNPIIEMLEKAVDEEFMSPQCKELYTICNSIDEIFTYLKSYNPQIYNKFEF